MDGGFSRLHWIAFATACRVACPPGGSDRGFPQPTRTFTSSFPTGRSPFPRLDILRWLLSKTPPMGLSPIGTSASIAARSASLHALRQRIPAFVRALRRYCTTVRLPINVHVGLLDHVLLQPARAQLRVGIDGTSRISRVKFPCIARVSTTAQSPINARDFAFIGVAFRLLDSVGALISDSFTAQ